MLKSRIEKVKNLLEEKRLDSFLVTDQNNIAYLTGFPGLNPGEREGFFYTTRNRAFFLTFPTYFGLFKDKESQFITLNITKDKRLYDHLNDIIFSEKLRTLAVEEDNLSLSEFESLRRKIDIKFKYTKGVLENLRLIKEDYEIDLIKKAAKLTDETFNFIKSKIKKGISGKEIALKIEFFIKRKKADIAFEPIVAFNDNAAIPHYIPSFSCKLKTNSLILLDFGAKISGYCSDMTRVIFFGSPKNRWVKIYETVRNSQELALKRLKPGISTDIPDKIARDYIKSQGFPDYPHGLGHGVGLAIHESPRLRSDNPQKLLKNMVVTVEPGIYMPGDCGVRIEDLVLLKREGIEILSKSPKLLKDSII